MKISIAKSLLEPVGISWFTLYDNLTGDVLVDEIMTVLEQGFILLERNKILPSAGGHCLTIGSVCNRLRGLARKQGAKEIMVGCMDLQRGAEVAGYLFCVTFTVPGKAKVHRVSLRTYS